MITFLTQLTLVFLAAALLALLARFFKQPAILGYLAAGVIAGHFGFFNLGNQGVFALFSDLGIMFLLFLVGLEINYDSLRLVGKHAIIIGISQIAFTSTIGFFLARFFAFPLLPALYIGVALTFSSTAIIVKILSEKRDLHSLYGKMSLGILLVQDVVAVSILLFLNSTHPAISAPLGLPLLIISGVALLVIILWIGRTLMPRILDFVASSSEMLFLVSLAWVFLVSTMAQSLGFSLAIGGFLAGIALARAGEHFEIASRVRPLRDFFILVFFVILGSSLVFSNLQGLGWPILGFSLFVLIGNPLIILAIMGLMGYRKRTSFMTSLTMAQISEFSLILAALGAKLGHLGSTETGLIAAVGIITIMISTHLMLHANTIFPKLTKLLGFFERARDLHEERFNSAEIERPIILIGFQRTGQNIALELPAQDLLVVDFDPQVIKEAASKKIAGILGDISDAGILDKLPFNTARVVISTSPDLENNLALLAYAYRFRPRPKLILRAETEPDAESLYEAGADYVLLPNFTAGQYLGKTIVADQELKMLAKLKKNDLLSLKKWRRIFG